jgi:hypothetical protein
MSLGKRTIDNRTMRHLRGSRLSIPNSPHGTAIVQDLHKQMTPNSWRALRADLRIYFEWVACAGLVGMPADEASVLAFVKWAADTNKSTATTLRYLSSVAKLHREAGLANPVTDAVRSAVAMRLQTSQAIAKDGGAANQALTAAVRAMLNVPWIDLIDLRNRLVLGLGWETGANSQTIVAIEWADIDLNGQAAPTVSIASRSSGQACYRLSKQTARDLTAWGDHFTPRQGPVLRRIHRVGTYYRNDFMLWPVKPLTSQSVTRCYRTLLDEARAQGLIVQSDDVQYDSLRRGLSARSVSMISPAQPVTC